MKEILFRGKRKYNGEWVYGYLVKKIDPLSLVVKYFILVQEYDTSCIDGKPTGLESEMSWYEVIPETIGQYTGRTDKNGKKIFEGDAVKVSYRSSDGESETEIKPVTYDEDACCFYPMRWNESCAWCDYSTEIKEIEIIGNIHDNPELLNVND